MRKKGTTLRVSKSGIHNHPDVELGSNVALFHDLFTGGFIDPPGDDDSHRHLDTDAALFRHLLTNFHLHCFMSGVLFTGDFIDPPGDDDNHRHLDTNSHLFDHVLTDDYAAYAGFNRFPRRSGNHRDAGFVDELHIRSTNGF